MALQPLDLPDPGVSCIMPSTSSEHRQAGSPGANPNGRPGGGPLDRLHRYLERLAVSEFYGKVVVSFQNGKVCDIKV
ncbi:MAG TPA: hypothetical protein VFK02_21035, partial [Kofleriaceae bacterium]|nr:hypothetical protein [Kofleriaceae bacterium]